MLGNAFKFGICVYLLVSVYLLMLLQTQRWFPIHRPTDIVNKLRQLSVRGVGQVWARTQ